MGRVEKTLDLGRKKLYQVEIPSRFGLAIGKVHGIGARETQQDAFGISDIKESMIKEKGVLLVLADGMGGMQDGEKASISAVVTCLDCFERHNNTAGEGEVLLEMLRAANEQVRRELGHNAGFGGSTILAAILKEGTVNWVSVGDSRIYLFQDGRLMQLNYEHNYAAVLEQMAENGEISFEEALTHPQRKALTSYIGLEEIPQIDSSEEPLLLKKGDRLLLMSDGVFGTLSQKEIEESMNYTAEKSAMYMGSQIERRKKQHQDNYTVLVVEVISEKYTIPETARAKP